MYFPSVLQWLQQPILSLMLQSPNNRHILTYKLHLKFLVAIALLIVVLNFSRAEVQLLFYPADTELSDLQACVMLY